jgi:hypothetical protein
MTEMTEADMDEFVTVFMTLDASEACGIILALIQACNPGMSEVNCFKFLAMKAKEATQ